MIAGFKIVTGITHQQAAKVYEAVKCKPAKYSFDLPINNPIRGVMVNYNGGNPLLWLSVNAGVLVTGKETGDILFYREPDFVDLDKKLKAALGEIIGAENADSLPPLKYWIMNTLLYGMDVRAEHIPELLEVFAKTDLPASNIFSHMQKAASSKGLNKPDIGSLYDAGSRDTQLKIAVKSDLIKTGRVDYKGMKEDILADSNTILRLFMTHKKSAMGYAKNFKKKLGDGMGDTELCLNPLVVTGAFVQAYVDSVGVGDFFTVDAALEKIERNIANAKNRTALKELVDLIGEKGSVPAARETAGDLNTFRESLQLLRDMGINGAPLEQSSGLKRIPNLFTEVANQCNLYASIEVNPERRPLIGYKIKKTRTQKVASLQSVPLQRLGEASVVAFRQGLLKASEEEQKCGKWLIRCGGPAVRLRMVTAGMITADSVDVNEAIDELMRIEKVSSTLVYLDRFSEYRTVGKSSANLIHNCCENCYETYMPFLEDIGLRKGIFPAFDVKMEKLREVYNYLFQVGDNFGAMILLIHMLKTGFCFSDMEAHVLKRLNEVYPVTEANRFDFYETDPSNIRQPGKWCNDRYKILKDEFNPYEPPRNGKAWLALPHIYDMELFTNFCPYTENREIREKTDAIMGFYLDEHYQSTGGDYGWHYAYDKKTYHASSGGVALPLYTSSELNGRYHFLWALEKLSLAPVMCQAAWFKKALDYCEKYKTGRNTYLFPVEFIHPSKMTHFYELYISKELLQTMKAEEKKSLAFENFSTLMVTLSKMRSRTHEKA